MLLQCTLHFHNKQVSAAYIKRNTRTVGVFAPFLQPPEQGIAALVKVLVVSGTCTNYKTICTCFCGTPLLSAMILHPLRECQIGTALLFEQCVTNAGQVCACTDAHSGLGCERCTQEAGCRDSLVMFPRWQASTCRCATAVCASDDFAISREIDHIWARGLTFCNFFLPA